MINYFINNAETDELTWERQAGTVSHKVAHQAELEPPLIDSKSHVHSLSYDFSLCDAAMVNGKSEIVKRVCDYIGCLLKPMTIAC